MPRPPRTAWALLYVLVAGCSLVTDFDRDQLAATAGDDGGGTHDEMDARVGRDDDGGLSADEAAVTDDDTGLGVACKGHADCPNNRLCCGDVCIAANESHCADCEAACAPLSANACNERVCGCGAGPVCSGDKKFCNGNGRDAACVQCRDASDCDGSMQCVQGTCAACDPMNNNSGCSGTTPICNPTTFTCEACKLTPDNCPGNPVCTPSGACGGCTANDAADCTNPTSPICNLSANPSVCRGCMGDAECMTELSRPYCVGNQRCSICNPTDDTGCAAASATPDCRLNANSVYQCQACNSNNACPANKRCDTASGKCVQCRNDDDCGTNSATPYCDTGTGTCRGCNTVPAQAANTWCALNTLLSQNSRPVCHASGRCVRCDGNVGCTGTAGRCLADAAAPQNNMCVECRQGMAGDCPAATPICTANGRCRACTAANEAADCPAGSANPACDVASGRCVPCTAARGCSGANGSCLIGTTPAMNRCVDCTGAGGNECSGNTPVCDTTSRTCVRCLAAGNAGCSGNTPLCCASTCVARDASNCAMCGDMCTGSNVCVAGTGGAFQCGCGMNANCPASSPLCTAGVCGACSDNIPCAGRDLAYCVNLQCRRCSPAVPSCPATEVCDPTTFTCIPGPTTTGGGAGISIGVSL